MIADQVVHTVERQLQRLQALPEHPKRAALAKLRKGIGRMPGDMPELWGSFLQGMPPELQSRDGTPSRGEWAVYLTLTLFALHQQGQERSMNQPGISLGAAVRKLADLDRDKKNKDAEPDESGVFRRFSALLTATSAEEISHHLRGIIQLLRREALPLDYPMLARDLYWLQASNSAPRVRLRWGQDYYIIQDQDKTGKGNTQ